MGVLVGVQAGRVCPRCGWENSIPLVYGLPGAEVFEQAEQGAVGLGGCVIFDDPAALVCRSCELPWGSESEPTADEAELAGLLDVRFVDLVRALGAGWRRESGADGQDGVAWFVSGEPAQVAIGVQGPWFVLARPLTSWGEVRPSPLMGDGPRFTSDDIAHDPYGIARVADDIASHRRRSFGWCRTCRRAAAPESFVASESACEQCVRLFSDPDG